MSASIHEVDESSGLLSLMLAADRSADCFASPKQRQTNWDKSPKMKNAAMKWDEMMVAWGAGDGEKLDGIISKWGNKVLTEKGSPSKWNFAEAVGIPFNFNTFKRYTCKDESMRTKIGTKLGRKRKAWYQEHNEESKHQDRWFYVYQSVIAVVGSSSHGIVSIAVVSRYKGVSIVKYCIGHELINIRFVW